MHIEDSEQHNLDAENLKSRVRNERSGILLYSFMGFVMVLILAYATTNIFESSYQYLFERLLGENKAQTLVDYYQWNHKSGEVVVSREPPESGVNYITFQASADLFSNDNQKDQRLIEREKAFLQAESDKASHRGQSQESASASADSVGGTHPTDRQPMGTQRKQEYCAELDQDILQLEKSRKYRTRYEDMHRDSDKLRKLRDLRFRSCR